MKMVGCLVLVLMVICCINAVEVNVKNLAGPPSDFLFNQLPSPRVAADVQNSASFSLLLSPTSDDRVLAQQMDLPVDSDEQFQFIFYSPVNSSLSLSLKSPDGLSVILQGTPTYYPVGDLQIPGTQYIFKKPKKGNYQLSVTSSPLSPSLYLSLSTPEPDAYVVLWNEDALATHTHLNTYALVTGQQIGLVSRVFRESFLLSDMALGKVPKALNATVQSAVMTVTLPSGIDIDEPMHDNGLMNDGESNDGVYGGLITASVPGQYIFTATIRGKNEDGDEYVRTTQQLATVVDVDVELTGAAIGSVDETGKKLNIYLAANAPNANKYKTYAEVWAVDSKGKEVAIAWIGGMATIQSNEGMSSLMMQLDLNWVSRAEAKEPLVLRNVVVQDIDTFVPIAQFDIIPVKTETPLDEVMAVQDLMEKNGEITNEMREGRMPASLHQMRAAHLNSTKVTLAMVHGYCTALNPFQVFPEDWTNPKFYLNPKKNLNHDQFAMSILAWAKDFGPFAYVGHSQGGAAGLHLKNFYWSGMDLLEGGRVVQSVGTPYQGSSGAGSAADLIKLFGVLCGANQDLSRDGAALWLKGVTKENREKVHYYTSTYIQGKSFGDYCNLATNLVLKWPNDGVTEHQFGQLPDGKNEGSLEGWCHSVDMKYPPQCENRERNKVMNEKAARTIKPQ